MSLKLDLINSKSIFYRRILGFIYLSLCLLSLIAIGGRYNFFHLNFILSSVAVCSFIFFGFIGLINILSNHIIFHGHLNIDNKTIEYTKKGHSILYNLKDFDELIVMFDDLVYKPSKERNLTNGGGNNYLVLKKQEENISFEFFIKSKEQEDELLSLIENLKEQIKVKTEKSKISKWRDFF